MKLSQLAQDPDAIEHGSWEHYGKGFRVKIASIRCAAFVNYLAQNRDMLPEDPEDGEGSAATPEEKERQNELWARGIAEHIIRDWSGLTDDHGAPLPYSADVAFEYLTEPRFEAFATWVMNKATAHATHSEARAKRDLGKSSAASVGTTDTPST